MESLTVMANIAEVVGVTIVIFGLFFAVLQMRQIREQRRELAAMLIGSTMEKIGVMTHQRIVPFTVVNHLIGASTLILWKN